ncbi:DNA repair exonuclease [Cyanobium sp. Morenito 9A2]|nr:DNA repair exonuclease [Cyanobium sp. Morenito 9A2]
MVSFLHSADWQIGKPYARVVDPDKRARLRQARLEVIERLGPLARSSEAAFLLVAGDLFDSPTPGASDVTAVCFALGRLGLPVLVIPGNHDHGAPGSLWHSAFFQAERQLRAPNVQVLLEPTPVVLEQAVVLPCPLLRRQHSEDPSAWLHHLDWNHLPPELPRIVLAHGSTSSFGAIDLEADDENPLTANNLLRLDESLLAAIDFVALGDWHGLKQVSPKVWYAGCPEQDRFPRASDYRSGQVLAVAVERGGAASVTVQPTGQLGWHQLRFRFDGDGDLDRFEQHLLGLLGDRVGQELLLLDVEGQLSLQGQRRYALLLERLEAQLLRLKRRGRIETMPEDQELAALTQRPGDPLIARVAAALQQRLSGRPTASGPGTAGDPAGQVETGVSGADRFEPEVVGLALGELHRLVQAGGS